MIDAVCAELERLRSALALAALELENQQDRLADWGAYASPYFQQKHDLNGDIERVRAAAIAARSAMIGSASGEKE